MEKKYKLKQKAAKFFDEIVGTKILTKSEWLSKYGVHENALEPTVPVIIRGCAVPTKFLKEQTASHYDGTIKRLFFTINYECTPGQNLQLTRYSDRLVEYLKEAANKYEFEILHNVDINQ